MPSRRLITGFFSTLPYRLNLVGLVCRLRADMVTVSFFVLSRLRVLPGGGTPVLLSLACLAMAAMSRAIFARS